MEKSRTVIFDIECDSLDPTVVWCVVCKDIENDEVVVFRRPDLDGRDFLSYFRSVDRCIGHNAINYDLPSLVRLVDGFQPVPCVDTLVVSRLLDYSRAGGHSLRSWGESLGVGKGEFNDFSRLTEEMVEYCIQDVHVCHAVYKQFLPFLNSPRWKSPIETELFVAETLREMHDNGFHFALDKAEKLRYNILEELEKLDAEILEAFPPKVRFVREVTPRITKFGTLNRNDFRWAGDDLSYFNGGSFSLIDYEDFNPGSPAQIVERLNEAGWQPTEKTKGHLQAIRDKDEAKIARMAKTGWMVSETNLNTLPDTAPPAAKKLALRITLASRARTLTEWIDAYRPETGRIHGTVNGLGAWTHRCSHVRPNTGNVPTPQPVNDKSTEVQRRAHEIDSLLRTYWQSAPGTWLVGVDAEGIQLRVLAHYINDPRFTAAVTEGRKEDGTDPHSLNKVALGDPCKSRNHAKTFIYAWLLGAGVGKVAQILECSHPEAKKACDDFIKFYPGLQIIKRDIIPRDAARGYFEGFDGRYVSIVGEDQSSKEHFTLAGYLQNGETTVMKRAKQIWIPRLKAEGVPFSISNFVHDEWQTEVQNPGNEFVEREFQIETKNIDFLKHTSCDFEVLVHDAKVSTIRQRVPKIPLYVAEVQADAIRQAGVDLNLRCPMAGAILSGHGGIAIGHNWAETH